MVQARKDKQTFETTLSTELSKREEELNTAWQEKVDKAGSNTEARWKIKYSGLEDELHTLQSRLDESQRCMFSFQIGGGFLKPL